MDTLTPEEASYRARDEKCRPADIFRKAAEVSDEFGETP